MEKSFSCDTSNFLCKDRYLKEKGEMERRWETDSGMERLVFVSFSCVGYLLNVNAEKEPVCAKQMMLCFASDSALPEEVNYKQVFRLALQVSSQD